MNKSKIYEAAFYIHVIFIGFCLFLIGMWALLKIWFLPMLALFLISILAFLMWKNITDSTCIQFVKKGVHSWLFMISLACMFGILVHMNLTNLSKHLIDGKTVSEEVYDEGDSENAAGWETVYAFKAQTKNGQTASVIIEWGSIGLGLLFLFITSHYHNKIKDNLKVLQSNR